MSDASAAWYQRVTTWHGGTSRCPGCGRVIGTGAIVIDDDYVAPPEPEWPQAVEGCTVCAERRAGPPVEAPPPWPAGKPRPLP